MFNDPIVEEIRAIRRAYAAKFNFDLHAMVQDLQRRERESGREYVNFPPRRISKPSVEALEVGSEQDAGEHETHS